MLTNPTEIGTARLPLRRSTRPTPTDASPNARRPGLRARAGRARAASLRPDFGPLGLEPHAHRPDRRHTVPAVVLSSTTPPRRATGPAAGIATHHPEPRRGPAMPTSRPTARASRVAGCTADAGARDLPAPPARASPSTGAFRPVAVTGRGEIERSGLQSLGIRQTREPASRRLPATFAVERRAETETLAMYKSINVSQRKMRLFRTWIR